MYSTHPIQGTHTLDQAGFARIAPSDVRYCCCRSHHSERNYKERLYTNLRTLTVLKLPSIVEQQNFSIKTNHHQRNVSQILTGFFRLNSTIRASARSPTVFLPTPFLDSPPSPKCLESAMSSPSKR